MRLKINNKVILMMSVHSRSSSPGATVRSARPGSLMPAERLTEREGSVEHTHIHQSREFRIHKETNRSGSPNRHAAVGSGS